MSMAVKRYPKVCKFTFTPLPMLINPWSLACGEMAWKQIMKAYFATHGFEAWSVLAQRRVIVEFRASL